MKSAIAGYETDGSCPVDRLAKYYRQYTFFLPMQQRDIKGYDNMDEAVAEDVLGYSGESSDKVIELVAECASRVYGILRHTPVEPGTEGALGCYIAALHRRDSS